MEVSTQTKFPGARLGDYWRVWEDLNVHLRVVLVLKQGYCLPFKEKPPLSRFPAIRSSYSSPVKQQALLESVQQMVQKSKKGSGSGSKQELSRILQSFVSGSKTRKQMASSNSPVWSIHICMFPPSKWKPQIEVIRASLQTGEWVASIDLTDAYFHVPIHPKFQKYLCFHVQGQAYQFRALPFGIATAPLEFTRVVKEVKFIALSQGVRIHQYLDDWLVRAKDRDTCARDVQKLITLVEKLGWIVN